MERILHFLPEKAQPPLVRYGATVLIMFASVAVQLGIEAQSGFPSVFFLLPGIFLAGVMFDRGSSFLATLIAATFGFFHTMTTLPFVAFILPLTLFIVTGVIVGIIGEGFRTEMEKVIAGERAKTVLLMELAHRTKNNLAMISAMMRLQAKAPNVNAQQSLTEMAARIQVMAQVYDHLTIKSDRKLVDAKQYLTEICQHLSASISGTNPVAITAHADELYIHSEQAVPIAIILNELVTNSLKYAFPDGQAGHIIVELHADEEVQLTVTDNGVGLKAQQSEGVGSRVISLLTQQLGGTLSHENLDQGCRVTLRMPKPPI
jgi:two-component sensor histidine kinase